MLWLSFLQSPRAMPAAALTATPAFAKIKLGENVRAGSRIFIGWLLVLAGEGVQAVDFGVEGLLLHEKKEQ